MVRCPFLPGREFADPDTLRSRLLDPDAATLQTLWDRLQTLVSEDRFLEIQMHLLGCRGVGVREDKQRLVDIYVSELFAQERREREQLGRAWRSEMKRRPDAEPAESTVSAQMKKAALSTQARLAKEREAREKQAAARREKIEAEKRTEQRLAQEREAEKRTEQRLAQEREAEQLLELVAEIQRRHEAEAGLSGLSPLSLPARLARDREHRATARRENLQRETRLAEEREAEELRKLYAVQASRRW
jgi:hypothetical protein